MSDRQKLFVTCVVDVAAIFFMLHFYPLYLVIILISLGIGALVVAVQEWWQQKFGSPTSLDSLVTERFGTPYWCDSSEFDDFTADLLEIDIGDLTCRYNAHSPYIRCAVNPDLDTCEECRDYQPIT